MLNKKQHLRLSSLERTVEPVTSFVVHTTVPGVADSATGVVACDMHAYKGRAKSAQSVQLQYSYALPRLVCVNCSPFNSCDATQYTMLYN